MAFHNDTIDDSSSDPDTYVNNNEKGDVERKEHVLTRSNSGFDNARTTKLLRKLDIRLLPFLSLLYLLSFLDRSNIGNARLAGLEESLGLEGLQYNIAVAIFFPPYVAAEVPSNLAMKRFRPSIWLPSIMLAWGLVCTLMGIVQNYDGILAARFFLGLAEGGLFPGVTYYITMWYRRHEVGFRTAIFFSAATAAGAFGGLLARGLVEMDGIAGLAGWSWIFIIEGIITFLVAIFAFFYLSDYPSTAKFLTQDERDEVVRRLEEDRASLADHFDMQFFWDAVKDWKIWVHMFITIGVYAPLYSLSMFLPSVVASLGYTNEQAQLMSVPPYVVACACCISFCWVADRMKQRGVFMIGSNLLALTGVVMLLASTNNNIKYAGAFLYASGIFPNVPQGVAWQGNNNGGSTKRGVGIAMHVGFGNLGGILASFIYLPDTAPRYIQGYSIIVGCIGMSTVLSAIMTIYYRRENARRDREHKPPSEYTADERAAERLMGDNASFFRYTY
ncbi:hypothetical protein MBLNU230_g4516t1 [Neophaeotheca triangularis]